jgi:hypothetical protein
MTVFAAIVIGLSAFWVKLTLDVSLPNNCVLIGERTIERREVFSGSAREIVYHTIEDIVKTIIKSFKGSHEL